MKMQNASRCWRVDGAGCEMISGSSLDDLLMAAESAVYDTAKFVSGSDVHSSGATYLTHDVKLDLDLAAQKYLADKLSECGSFPVVGEEDFSLPLPSKPYWLIDPIDGSFNYLAGIRYAAVSAALVGEDCALIGVIGDIYSDDLISARVAGGVRLNGRRLQRVETSARGEGLVLTAVTPSVHKNPDGLRHLFEEIRPYRKIRMLGSASMSLSLLSRGVCEAVVLSGIHAWDVMAGCVIAREAGCQVDWKITDETCLLGELLAKRPLAIK